MTQKIPIFYTIDQVYAPLTAVSIHSLLKNASPDYQYEIYVIHDGIDDDTQEMIKRLETKNSEIHFQTMKQSLDVVPKTYLLNMSYFTLTIYFRLFLPEMFPEYDRGIYLDADTILLGDISEFYRKDLEDNMIGAVIDPTISGVPVFSKYMSQVVGVDETKYVNSGVLLMDFHKLRSHGFAEHFLRLLTKYEFETIAPDQDYLNSILFGRIKFLEHEWNVQPSSGGNAVADKNTTNVPKLIHYNLFNKPWHYKDVEFAEYFWAEAKETEFWQIIAREEREFTEEGRARDRASLEAMFDSAEKIMASDKIRFKDVETMRLRDL